MIASPWYSLIPDFLAFSEMHYQYRVLVKFAQHTSAMKSVFLPQLVQRSKHCYVHIESFQFLDCALGAVRRTAVHCARAFWLLLFFNR